MHTSRSISGISRRHLLAGAAGIAALGRTRLAFAGGSGSGPKLVVINVIGGLDGLSVVVPYGDANLGPLRGGLVPKHLLKIDSMFAFDPNLRNIAQMFGAGQALAVHCVGPIGDSRSHFIGQDLLQGGSTALTTDGWINRALPFTGYDGQLQAGLALGATAPLAIRGSALTAGWTGDPYATTPSLMQTVIQTAVSNDPDLSAAYSVAFQDLSVFSTILKGHHFDPNDTSLTHLAEVAGVCLAAPGGPQVAILETESVDTHAEQMSRQPALFADIDNAFAALQRTLGSAWSDTVVMTMTEFGRTAYENGTEGTDHGTGFAVLLAGGAVAGGQVVVVDGWQNQLSQLYQGRDLGYTVDFRQVAMGVLADHMGLSSAALQAVFPNNGGLAPLEGLIQ